MIENLSTLSIIENFETADISDSVLLFSSNVSEADERFEKLIDNNNLTY